MGPAHPSSAGLLEGTFTEEDGVITAIDPKPGALHRGAEMIFQSRDFRQALSLANRHDWQAPFFGELALAQAVEDSLGVEIPARAAGVRTLLAEHTRVASHLAHLSFVGHFLADEGLSVEAEREELRRRLAELTGNRLHSMAVRLGGVAVNPDPAWADAERATLARASEAAHRLLDAIGDRFGAGIAPVAREIADAYGLAGPCAIEGDANARFRRLADEIVAAASAACGLLDALPEGPLVAHMPKIVKLPEGDWASSVDAPLGRAGVVIVSRGEKTPWRLKLRTASWANVSVWPRVLPGTRVADLPIAMASLPWVAGDLDK